MRRIHVTYHLAVEESLRETVDRVHAMHAPHCPVYRTVRGCIDVTTEWVRDG